jgi:hypothetical protein
MRHGVPTTMRLGPSVLVAVAAFAMLFAGQARADVPVLPTSDSLPWTDPAHHSPLEDLSSSIASQIAGRQASVICDGESDWQQLSVSYGFDPNWELGFVPFSYYLGSRTIVEDASTVFLSPRTCLSLLQFGRANPKPTKCSAIETHTTIVYKTVRYKTTVSVRVKRRMRVNGKWVVGTVVVKRTVWKTKQVPQAVTTSTTGAPEPCYVARTKTAKAGQPDSYWQAYEEYALGMLVLGHESVHLTQSRAGASIDAVLPTSETNANCYGLQRIASVAQRLGATADDAQAIAAYAYDSIYPGYQGASFNGSPYWSADCRQDGPLDLTPGDGIWP